MKAERTTRSNAARLHLTAELEAQFAESARLEAQIRESLKRVTYGVAK
jgi:hypothetical protein